MPQFSKIDDGGLWDILTTHQGEQFATCGRGSLPGKQFTYTIKGGEMFISTKEKSITKSSVVMAYQKALLIQSTKGCVTGPKKIGTFGASYLFPIFLRLGFITRTPLTLLVESGTIEKNSERMDIMPRPKGSKNKKMTTPSVATELQQTVESINERIAEAEKAIETLNADLKAKKAELKELTKLKEQAEAAAAAKKAEEDKIRLLEAVEASGKTVDEILELLKQ